MSFDVDANTILLVQSGSRAYGTNLPGSDYDYKGIAIAPIGYYVGFARSFEQREELVSKGASRDCVTYEIRKFFRLAAECNPNIIEMLWSDEYEKLTVVGQKIVENRELFLSKKAKHTFSGYAHAQLKRIKSHRRWLLDPPHGKPERSVFGLPENKVLSQENAHALGEAISNGESFSAEVLDAINKEREYAAALAQWKQFENWKATRNPARAELEAKCGFDAKHAMHLVRLYRMAVEILSGKGCIVKRPDAQELLEIRNGNWTYSDIILEAARLEDQCSDLYETSTLRHSPSIDLLDGLCQDSILSHLGIYGGN